MTDPDRLNRRTVLTGIGAASVGGLAGCMGDGDDTEPDDQANTDPDNGEPNEVRETFELDGITGGWNGISPAAIADTTNPTLALTAGETYRLVWTNEDGAPHDFVILDDDGERIVGTDIFSNEGDTHELVFEVTEEMVAYHCSVHRNTMRSDIAIEGVNR